MGRTHDMETPFATCMPHAENIVCMCMYGVYSTGPPLHLCICTRTAPRGCSVELRRTDPFGMQPGRARARRQVYASGEPFFSCFFFSVSRMQQLQQLGQLGRADRTRFCSPSPLPSEWSKCLSLCSSYIHTHISGAGTPLADPAERAPVGPGLSRSDGAGRAHRAKMLRMRSACLGTVWL